MTESESLAEFYNNCDPATPAGDAFYANCTDVRGGAMFPIKLCKKLSQTKGRIPSLFTGHIGCGKSSEINHLATSMLQRRFKIGYTRAARLVDLMEHRGIVGPLDGAKPREIRMSRD